MNKLIYIISIILISGSISVKAQEQLKTGQEVWFQKDAVNWYIGTIKKLEKDGYEIKVTGGGPFKDVRPVTYKCEKGQTFLLEDGKKAFHYRMQLRDDLLQNSGMLYELRKKMDVPVQKNYEPKYMEALKNVTGLLEKFKENKDTAFELLAETTVSLYESKNYKTYKSAAYPYAVYVDDYYREQLKKYQELIERINKINIPETTLAQGKNYGAIRDFIIIPLLQVSWQDKIFAGEEYCPRTSYKNWYMEFDNPDEFKHFKSLVEKFQKSNEEMFKTANSFIRWELNEFNTWIERSIKENQDNFFRKKAFWASVDCKTRNEAMNFYNSKFSELNKEIRVGSYGVDDLKNLNNIFSKLKFIEMGNKGFELFKNDENYKYKNKQNICLDYIAVQKSILALCLQYVRGKSDEELIKRCGEQFVRFGIAKEYGEKMMKAYLSDAEEYDYYMPYPEEWKAYKSEHKALKSNSENLKK